MIIESIGGHGPGPRGPGAHLQRPGGNGLSSACLTSSTQYVTSCTSQFSVFGGKLNRGRLRPVFKARASKLLSYYSVSLVSLKPVIYPYY